MEGKLFVCRTPWKARLIRIGWQFPYLFHRWDVGDLRGNWYGGFFRKSSAKRWLRELNSAGVK